jgi:hypothetical protein
LLVNLKLIGSPNFFLFLQQANFIGINKILLIITKTSRSPLCSRKSLATASGQMISFSGEIATYVKVLTTDFWGVFAGIYQFLRGTKNGSSFGPRGNARNPKQSPRRELHRGNGIIPACLRLVYEWKSCVYFGG